VKTVIRKLRAEDVRDFRALRLKAMKDVPHAFGATLADEKRTTDKTHLLGFGIGARSDFVLGAFVDGRLAGVAGFRRFGPGNLKHKGAIWGMYVAPEHRGQGIGAALLRDCLERAGKAPGLELIQLAVESGNKSAIGLYRRAGFRRYAVEKGGLKVGGTYYDEDLMQARAKG
jgi:ribosomal protein S18 acetylase RimI-like enzyme